LRHAVGEPMATDHFFHGRRHVDASPQNAHWRGARGSVL
jgi:hypothetical protein